MTNEHGGGSRTYQLLVERVKVIKESTEPTYEPDVEALTLQPAAGPSLPVTSPLKRKAVEEVALTPPKKRAFPDLVSPRKRVAQILVPATPPSAAPSPSLAKGKGKAIADEEEELDYE